MRGLGQSKHSPAEIASLHLVLAFAQPGHEGVGEPALLVAVRFQPIHRNGILGKMGHLAEQACRHPPVLPRVALHCLLWGEGPPVCTNPNSLMDKLHGMREFVQVAAGSG